MRAVDMYEIIAKSESDARDEWMGKMRDGGN